ncbi:MAG: GNAT family N-acetyltransferase [Gammaproteobacteria bacterium]|jgi:N-acetylglutamate synthase-like GNAT family acetyltransferase
MVDISVRPASGEDLTTINQIITDCVYSWNLSDRVKRLTLQSYHYDILDLDHLDIFVAANKDDDILGIAALESANSSDLPANLTGLLLHGLYVAPDHQKKQVGKILIDHSMEHVKQQQMLGLLVKAQPDANSYFEKQGFERLPVDNISKDYPHRWWKAT